MADQSQGEKTEEPTQQRREDFRKRGQVAQTKELASAVMLLSILLVMWGLGRFFLEQLLEVFIRTFGDLLVGFKWIAGVIDDEGPEWFLYGTEESHGYMAGSYVRDKDGAVASLLLCELAAMSAFSSVSTMRVRSRV